MNARGLARDLHAGVHARFPDGDGAAGTEAEGRDLDDPVRQPVGSRRLEVEDDERSLARESGERGERLGGKRVVRSRPHHGPGAAGVGRGASHTQTVPGGMPGGIRPREARRVQERERIAARAPAGS